MKFTITQAVLNKALQTVGKATGQNRIIPILESIRFKINKSECILYGNNLKECISLEIAVDCKTATDIAINYADLSALISSLSDQPLTFDVTNLVVIITASTGVYEMACENGIDFPVPHDEIVANTEIEAADLNEGIFRTLFACSMDDLRPAFTGICLEFATNKLVFMGTDANIASVFTLECDIKLNNTCILPTNAAKILQALSLTGMLGLSLTDNHLVITQGDLTIHCTLIHEKYPPLKSVIPDNELSLEIDRAMLIASIKRVSKFAYQFVKLSLGESVSVEGENLDFGKVAKETLVAKYTGDDLVIGTDAEWLVNCLSHCVTDSVWLTFSAPNRAILIREVESTEKDNLMLCMPLMIDVK